MRGISFKPGEITASSDKVTVVLEIEMTKAELQAVYEAAQRCTKTPEAHMASLLALPAKIAESNTKVHGDKFQKLGTH